jgi:prevent-host-death family protein
MARAGVAELKAGLSAFLRRVQAGEEVIVTDRGHPVARLVPMIGAGETPDADLEDLIATGLVRRRDRAPDRRRFEEMANTPELSDPEGRFLAALLEERSDGR